MVFSTLFEHTYYSHEIGLRKPDKEIFEFIVNKESLHVKETLFIDDLKANVNGAIQAGLAGYCLERGQSLISFQSPLSLINLISSSTASEAGILFFTRFCLL